MQDSSIVLYNGPRSMEYEPFSLINWYDSSSYDDATQDGSYDDSYYLTYQEVDDYSSRSWYKNRGTNQDYKGKEIPYSISGTCLGDYTRYFGENEAYTDEGYGAYGSSLEREESSLAEGDKYQSHFNYNDDLESDYGVNPWFGYDGLGFGGGGMEDDVDDSEHSSCSWDD